jgi:hypothetical protein
MSEKNNGGPAFPFSMTVEELPHDAEPGKLCVPIKSTRSFPGMTLRDYFAAKALQGAIYHRGFATVGDNRDLDAKDAYAYADAMLKARDA